LVVVIYRQVIDWQKERGGWRPRTVEGKGARCEPHVVGHKSELVVNSDARQEGVQ
jgi:hypothetical protein